MTFSGVRKEDLELQCVEWGGMLFVELRMTFGCGSSPWYFNITSDVVKEITAKNIEMKERDVPKCLDDAIPIQDLETGLVAAFEKEYRRLCGEVGIKLAGNDYVGKTFSVSRVGEVLGLDYDLVKWRWNIPESKMLRLLAEVKLLVTETWVNTKMVQRVMGKINHYFPVIPGGKMNRSWLLRLERDAERDGMQVKVDRVTKTQAMWWVAMLMASRHGTSIPDPRFFVAEGCVNIYTDAAGGGVMGEKDGGMGGVTWEVPCRDRMMWMMFRWPQWLLDEKESSLGVGFSKKLTTLEGLACLTQLAVGHRELKGCKVRLWCDNAGFVAAWNKGSSTCLYVATISKALYEVARGLDIGVDVAKTGRMSGPGERAADALSKGDMERAWKDIGEVRENRARRVPRVIQDWIRDPVPDPDMGKRILQELAGQEENLEWEKIKNSLTELRLGAEESAAESVRCLARDRMKKRARGGKERQSKVSKRRL